MNEFEDGAKLQMIGGYSSAGAAHEDAESRTDTFACRIADVGHVGLHSGIEMADLVPQGGLDLLQFMVHQSKGKMSGIARIDLELLWHFFVQGSL